MKITKLFFFVILFNFCNPKTNDNLAEDIPRKKIENIVLLNENKVDKMIPQKEFINELKELKRINGIWKFKRSKIVVFYKDGIVDTIYTNGTLFLYKNNYYRRIDDKCVSPSWREQK